MPKKTELTQAQWCEIARLYTEGVTVREIVAAYHLDHNRMLRALREMGVETRKQGRPAGRKESMSRVCADWSQLRDDVLRLRSLRKIADERHVSRYTVARHIDAMGLRPLYRSVRGTRSDAEWQEIARAYAAGASIAALAARHRMNKETLRAGLRSRGVQTRKAGRTTMLANAAAAGKARTAQVKRRTWTPALHRLAACIAESVPLLRRETDCAALVIACIDAARESWREEVRA